MKKRVHLKLSLQQATWTPGDYENRGGAQMVKIKDFTLDSQNLGGTCLPPPRGLHTGSP